MSNEGGMKLDPRIRIGEKSTPSTAGDSGQIKGRSMAILGISILRSINHSQGANCEVGTCPVLFRR